MGLPLSTQKKSMFHRIFRIDDKSVGSRNEGVTFNLWDYGFVSSKLCFFCNSAPKNRSCNTFDAHPFIRSYFIPGIMNSHPSRHARTRWGSIYFALSKHADIAAVNSVTYRSTDKNSTI